MRKVFIINGMARAGKDTFCKYVSEMYKDTYHFSIVDLTKTLAKQLGWNEEKDEKGRKFLCELKRITDEYDDRNFQRVVHTIEHIDSGNTVFLVDMREPQDIARARQELDAKVVFVKNTNVPVISSNYADAGVFDIVYDIEIDNSGTLDDLKDKAKDFIDKYIKG